MMIHSFTMAILKVFFKNVFPFFLFLRKEYKQDNWGIHVNQLNALMIFSRFCLTLVMFSIPSSNVLFSRMTHLDKSMTSACPLLSGNDRTMGILINWRAVCLRISPRHTSGLFFLSCFL